MSAKVVGLVEREAAGRAATPDPHVGGARVVDLTTLAGSATGHGASARALKIVKSVVFRPIAAASVAMATAANPGWCAAHRRP